MREQLGKFLKKKSGVYWKRTPKQDTKESDLSGMKRNGWLDYKNGNGKTKAYNELSW